MNVFLCPRFIRRGALLLLQRNKGKVLGFKKHRKYNIGVEVKGGDLGLQQSGDVDGEAFYIFMTFIHFQVLSMTRCVTIIISSHDEHHQLLWYDSSLNTDALQ